MRLSVLRSILFPLGLLALPAWVQPTGTIPWPGTASAVLTFRLRDPAGLHELLEALYDPRSPSYHHFLTPKEFAHRFAPLRRDRQAVAHWLDSRGLHVTERFRDGMALTVVGSKQAMETSIGPSSLALPGFLRSTVASVSASAVPSPDRPVDLDMRPSATNAHFTGSTPADLARMYQIDQLHQAGLLGQGQTIALFEHCDFDDADVTAYDQHFGIQPGRIVRIPVSDGTRTGVSLGPAEAECELDIELVQAVAPAATILVYEAPSTQAGTLAMWNQMMSDGRASVISASYGHAETYDHPDQIEAVDTALAEAATQGQAIFVASGDHGAYAASGFAPPAKRHDLVVDFPATDPWVTAVGGTMLTGGEEVAWHTSRGHGGGGGLSQVFPQPFYQDGPGVKNRYSNGKRQVPDVSALATNLSIFTVYKHGSAAKWGQMAGTSASTPIWASVVTLLNQALGKPLGFFDPTVYGLGNRRAGTRGLHDITQGNNLYYPATRSWDFATGWGSPNASMMLSLLKPSGHALTLAFRGGKLEEPDFRS